MASLGLGKKHIWQCNLARFTTYHGHQKSPHDRPHVFLMFFPWFFHGKWSIYAAYIRICHSKIPKMASWAPFPSLQLPFPQHCQGIFMASRVWRPIHVPRGMKPSKHLWWKMPTVGLVGLVWISGISWTIGIIGDYWNYWTWQIKHLLSKPQKAS